MKKVIICAVAMLAAIGAKAFIPEMMTIELSDGETVTGRLCLPDSAMVSTIVVVIHGTGPNTYLDKRPGFNYYDVLADGFCEQGVGFFSYDRRGVSMGDEPPMYHKIDSAKYRKYTPSMEAADVESMVAVLKKDRRFRDCKIALYGISEGTMIATMVAEHGNVKIDALLLHGYAHDNMYDIIRWQDEGNSSIRQVNEFFDKNGNKAVSPEEYNAEGQYMDALRAAFFQNLPMDSLDVVKDGILDVEDMRILRMPFHKVLMDKITKGDEGWIQANYVHLTMPWLREHFALEPNKTRMLRLDLPIFIFHGTDDANVPVESVYDISERFRVCAKTNLATFVFGKHNHTLDFETWLTTKKHSEGQQKVFDIAAKL